MSQDFMWWFSFQDKIWGWEIILYIQCMNRLTMLHQIFSHFSVELVEGLPWQPETKLCRNTSKCLCFAKRLFFWTRLFQISTLAIVTRLPVLLILPCRLMYPFILMSSSPNVQVMHPTIYRSDSNKQKDSLRHLYCPEILQSTLYLCYQSQQFTGLWYTAAARKGSISADLHNLLLF